MTFRDLSGALRIVGGAFVGIVLYSNFGPQPEPVYRDVIVPEERIVEVERIDTIVQWRERIVYKHTPATQIATAPDAGQPDVDVFCADAIRRATRADTNAPDTNARDTVNNLPPAVDSHLLLRSVRTTDPWFLGKPSLILTGPTSTGDLRQLTYDVRDGFEARVHADSVIVRYPRHAVLKQLLEFGIVFGAGYLANEVLP